MFRCILQSEKYGSYICPPQNNKKLQRKERVCYGRIRIRQQRQLEHKMRRETRIISTSLVQSITANVSASTRPPPPVTATKQTPRVREEVQPSQTWLSTLLFLSQKNKILRLVLEQMEIYPNENQMINAKKIFSLWNSFSSLI